MLPGNVCLTPRSLVPRRAVFAAVGLHDDAARCLCASLDWEHGLKELAVSTIAAKQRDAIGVHQCATHLLSLPCSVSKLVAELCHTKRCVEAHAAVEQAFAGDFKKALETAIEGKLWSTALDDVSFVPLSCYDLLVSSAVTCACQPRRDAIPQ